MALDLQRVDDQKLLQLPHVNPVAAILDVLADGELQQVLGAFADRVLLYDEQLIRKQYRELDDDGWECVCMMCGRAGLLLTCEHGLRRSDSKAQCAKVAHAKCVGIVAPPRVFICPLHPNSCCGADVIKQLEAKPPAPSASLGITQSQVVRGFKCCTVCVIVRCS